MKFAARLENPDAMGVTITVTMPLGHWKLIRRDLLKMPYGACSGPTHAFSQSVAELVARTGQTILGQEPGAAAPEQPVAEAAPQAQEPAPQAAVEAPQPAAQAAPARRRPAPAAGAQA